MEADVISRTCFVFLSAVFLSALRKFAQRQPIMDSHLVSPFHRAMNGWLRLGGKRDRCSNAPMTEDRDRWNERYRAGEHSGADPNLLLTQLDSLLPRSGHAIDVAGGVGRNSLWLANRGLQVTLADTSDVALNLARERATRANLSLHFLQIDLEREPFPDGPWDLIVIVHYLWRPLFRQIPRALTPGGRLVVIQPTKSNLQRHAKPSERFLLDDGELPSLVPELEQVYYQEGWLVEGRHEAVLVAQFPTAACET